ncbi:MipA/OmpV family protein [Serratia plymuthica]|uniref:Structural protein MipA n=1 Tax=Serratia plymuthica S13 TaxID=1348660 RepID=S4YKE8_SERPL|nr:MipA/OmpV family protein [Serratia plymuthica]AGP45862.1 structural protein MipA [Serratia plymuthica S13]ANJ94328.1 structural protein MipA [Serratia plymuthica]ANK00216.1 structural protein MipA [Serratia plymuthica]EKF62723.1 mltA-interacting MipA family protein [Serratia plymuthica A30]KYG16239.1 MltA-interacting protein MipA [Serratia plymuthica]
MKNTLGYSAVTLLMLFPLQGFTQDDGEASLKLSGGMAVAPVYQGASSYSAVPLYDIQAGYDKSAWGDFSLGLIDGARWQLPLSGPFGIALLAGYDDGRDEEVKTLSGRNKRLKGMGDLDGALEAGIELSYKFDPFHAFVKGMQATKARRYGDEDLGHTAYVDLGVAAVYSLSETLTLSSDLSTTWANSGYQRGYFGVTQRQAQQTSFAAYRPGSGFKQVTLNGALNYQWTPEIAFQAGAGIYTLLGDAAKSPIVEKKVAGVAFLGASYSF